MGYAIGASIGWLLFLTVAFSLVTWAYRRRLKRLERSILIDPATLTGTPYALEREFNHAISLPNPLSLAEIQISECSRAIEAAMVLRTVCIHGLDQVYCLDLARGVFLLVIYGKLHPSEVADFFLGELRAHGIAAKIGWAYTCSAEPAVRQGVRAAAHAALERVASPSGIEVALVELDKWPADDRSELVLGDLRTRREALCLSRRELALLIGVSDVELRNIETGRARPARVADFIQKVLGTIEDSVARVQKLDALMAASRQPPPAAAAPAEASAAPAPPADPPADGAGRRPDVQEVIAQQRAILAQRSGGVAAPTPAACKEAAYGGY